MADRYCIVENGVVVNAVMLDTDDKWPVENQTAVQSDTAGIGWSYDATEGKFTAPPEEPTQQAEAPVSPSIGQVETMLSKMGLNPEQTKGFFEAAAKL